MVLTQMVVYVHHVQGGSDGDEHDGNTAPIIPTPLGVSSETLAASDTMTRAAPADTDGQQEQSAEPTLTATSRALFCRAMRAPSVVHNAKRVD